MLISPLKKNLTLQHTRVSSVVTPWLETTHSESVLTEDILWNVIEQIKVLILQS
jgi:hypothetical protein